MSPRGRSGLVRLGLPYPEGSVMGGFMSRFRAKKPAIGPPPSAGFDRCRSRPTIGSGLRRLFIQKPFPAQPGDERSSHKTWLTIWGGDRFCSRLEKGAAPGIRPALERERENRAKASVHHQDAASCRGIGRDSSSQLPLTTDDAKSCLVRMIGSRVADAERMDQRFGRRVAPLSSLATRRSGA
jgi:hypothetical protein